MLVGVGMRYQFHHAVGQRKHPGVVGGHHHHPFAGREVADQREHLLDLDVVQVCGRFIGDQQRWVQCDGPGDRNPLLLSAAEITGPVRHPVCQADAGQQFLGPFVGLLLRNPGRTQRHHHVLQRGEARHQVEGLEHDPDGVAPVVGQRVRVEGGQVDVPELDTAGRRPQNPAKTGQQGGLTASAGAQQNCQRARRDVQAQFVDRAHRLLAAGVLHHEVFDPQVGHRFRALRTLVRDRR